MSREDDLVSKLKAEREAMSAFERAFPEPLPEGTPVANNSPR